MADEVAKKITHYLKLVIEYLPEKERPNVEEAAAEYIKTAFEASLTENFKGCRLIAGFTEKSAAYQYKNWKPNNGDVLIASFPKTGTTWVTEIVKYLLGKDNSKEMEILLKLSPFYIYISRALPSMQETYNMLPLTKKIHATHLPSYCINMKRLKESGCKIIYTLRNPKDQLVSWYQFRLALPRFDTERMLKLYPKEWDAFFDSYISGQHQLFSKQDEWYPHHILSWYSYRNDENVKFVYYEDLKKDPAKHIKEIADFLEVKCTEAEIEEIIQNTSIEDMKKRRDDATIRKGGVGGWKNRFTVAQSELMDEKFNEVLKDVDVHFDYG